MPTSTRITVPSQQQFDFLHMVVRNARELGLSKADLLAWAGDCWDAHISAQRNANALPVRESHADAADLTQVRYLAASKRVQLHVECGVDGTVEGIKIKDRMWTAPLSTAEALAYIRGMR